MIKGIELLLCFFFLFVGNLRSSASVVNNRSVLPLRELTTPLGLWLLIDGFGFDEGGKLFFFFFDMQT